MVYVGIVLFHGVFFLFLLLFGWFLVLLEYFDYFSFHFVLKFRDGNKFEAFDALKNRLKRISVFRLKTQIVYKIDIKNTKNYFKNKNK